MSWILNLKDCDEAWYGPIIFDLYKPKDMPERGKAKNETLRNKNFPFSDIFSLNSDVIQNFEKNKKQLLKS